MHLRRCNILCCSLNRSPRGPPWGKLLVHPPGCWRYQPLELGISLTVGTGLRLPISVLETSGGKILAIPPVNNFMTALWQKCNCHSQVTHHTKYRGHCPSSGHGTTIRRATQYILSAFGTWHTNRTTRGCGLCKDDTLRTTQCHLCKVRSPVSVPCIQSAKDPQSMQQKQHFYSALHISPQQLRTFSLRHCTPDAVP